MITLENLNVKPTPHQVSFCLYGDPKPQQRPRFSGRHVYDSQKHIKQTYATQLEDQMGIYKPFSSQIHVDFTFYMEMPKRSRSRQGLLHVCRPDLSNLIKLIEDAGNGIIYTDDCIIASMTAKKVYDSKPRTELVVREII
jgi:Holliday junction resolvase RusA-like endonuclease